MAYDPQTTTLTVGSHLSTLGSDPVRNFKFLVQINHEIASNVDGSLHKIATKIGFVSVSGFSAQTAAIPYRSGGMNTTPQMHPGQTSFTPVSMTRGIMLGSNATNLWFKQLFTVQVGEGQFINTDGMGFRANVDVWVLPHPRTDTSKFHPVAKYTIYNAWPSSINFSDLNAGDNAYIVENMTLTHEGWDFVVFEPGSPDKYAVK